MIFYIFKLIGLIPRPFSFRIGNLIGRIWFLLDKKHRKIAIDNLTIAFGKKKDSDEIRSLAGEVFKNLGQIIFEIGWSLHLKQKEIDKYFYIRGLSNYRAAYEKNKGVLALTAHTGNWEFLSVIAAMTGYPVNVIYRPLDFNPLNQFFQEFRTMFGSTKAIPNAHAMRKILKNLKAGEVIAMMMDQNVDWYEGVFVDFFGKRACTNKGLAILALKTESPVMPVFLVRDGSRFVAEFYPELPLIKTGDKIKDIEENTQQYNQVIESFIRQYPAQWFWVHNRWKTRPYQAIKTS